MPREVACRKCKAVTMGKVCPICKSSELTPDWYGVILIFDSNRSKIASLLDIHTAHKYALKVS
ncbi:MAG TPA: transcription elongation factor subunit Spt4 [Nitrososphaeraceae archaeon]|jgi:DNA-directed RNA polymerase subunit E"|nr:transcription elongation factor subunit Spt4 [Nitrososphaeraceae archaeon]